MFFGAEAVQCAARSSLCSSFLLYEKGKTRQQKRKHAVDNVQFCSRFPKKRNCLLIRLKLSRELKLSQFGQAIFIIVVGFSY